MSVLSRVRGLLGGGGPPRPQRLPSPDELTLLSGGLGGPEAELYRGILADNGLRAMVKNLDPISVNYGGMGPPLSCELWVMRKDLRAAREVLAFTDEGEA